MNIFSRAGLKSFCIPLSRANFKSKLGIFFKYQFTTQNSKTCAHNKSDFYNLLAVTKKNQPRFLEFLNKYPDNKFVCFLVQMVLELCFGNPQLMESLIPKFLKIQLDDPSILLDLYRGLPKAKPELLDRLAPKIQTSVIDLLPKFRESNLREMIEITKLLPEKYHELTVKINEFLSLDSALKTDLYIKSAGLETLIETEKSSWKIIKFDPSNKEFRLLCVSTGQEIIVCGCDSFPNENLDHVLNLMEQEKNQINLLIVQDIPILDKKYKGESSTISMEKKSKKLSYYFKTKNYLDELEGGLLEYYVKSFINNEFFVLNLKERKIYQKVNDHLFIPSELGSTVLRFVLNASDQRSCKVVLADYPTIFQIAEYNKSLSIDHVRDLLPLCNLVNLLEKSVYSYSTYLLGCHKCNPKENHHSSPNKFPRDYISILTGGDILFPNKPKSDYISQKIIKTIAKYPDHPKILILVSSQYAEPVIKNMFLHSQKGRLGSLESFSEMASLKNALEIFQQVDKDHLILEKTVIYETLFATFCMDLQKVNQEDPRTNFAFQKYLDFTKFYRESFTYEALSEFHPQEDLVVGEEGSSDEEVKEDKIYVCPSHTIVFGDKESKTLIKKFYLNSEYKRHFQGSEKEVREMVKLYQEINAKTKIQEEVYVEEVDKIKPKGKEGGAVKLKRKKRSKNEKEENE